MKFISFDQKTDKVLIELSTEEVLDLQSACNTAQASHIKERKQATSKVTKEVLQDFYDRAGDFWSFLYKIEMDISNRK